MTNYRHALPDLCEPLGLGYSSLDKICRANNIGTPVRGRMLTDADLNRLKKLLAERRPVGRPRKN